MKYCYGQNSRLYSGVKCPHQLEGAARRFSLSSCYVTNAQQHRQQH